MFRKFLIKLALRKLTKIIESSEDYGSCEDYGILNINSDFDEHVITIKKSNIESKTVVRDESVYENKLTVSKSYA